MLVKKKISGVSELLWLNPTASRRPLYGWMFNVRERQGISRQAAWDPGNMR